MTPDDRNAADDPTRPNHGVRVDVTRDRFSPRSPLTVPGFFSALEDGYLLAAVCDGCGTVMLPPRAACFECGNDSVHVENQPRTGTVVSYTEVRYPPGGFKELGPYTVGIVELESGVRLSTRIDASLAETTTGMEVALRLEDDRVNRDDFDLEMERDWPMFVFEPVDGEASEPNGESAMDRLNPGSGEQS